MFITLYELLDIVIMTLGVGYIFMDIFRPKEASFNLRALGLSCLVTAPGIILHELGHKFTAIAFGVEATFHAAYKFLALGIFLKLVSSPFIFFVPGYVSIPANLPALQSAFVAFAGPAINGLLYLAAVIALQKQLSPKWHLFWSITRKLNGFLFIFNFLPIPGFDGFHFFTALFA